ncbi:hypothetical protein CSKR_110524 [Clonorchis sinensis]|uniref:Uncharacterized protein n=1 Tax=Clonorchis sinensis TaxID=79923 RepID=A0A419PQ24_CLOSI|nr:hypothetical protein CSKR_110524 [Clonorchis sinensis]
MRQLDVQLLISDICSRSAFNVINLYDMKKTSYPSCHKTDYTAPICGFLTCMLEIEQRPLVQQNDPTRSQLQNLNSFTQIQPSYSGSFRIWFSWGRLTGISAESVVDDIPRLNLLHKARFMFQLVR